MGVSEAREICKGRTMWKSIVSTCSSEREHVKSSVSDVVIALVTSVDSRSAAPDPHPTGVESLFNIFELPVEKI
ncbi:hypothetical protein EVAR_12306_1 [Eumeta japonica]|uniref:Uncharacterized protein n=1 Tax=Eumeta variegata TaxID=151549 RepID=A0A4C1TUB9_EUMVA|nr:hypothetical protein EVAR_12306_1 [Eumeta japonica]